MLESTDVSRVPKSLYAARNRIEKEVITKLNLASQPFRNRTLPYLIALFLLALSAIGAIYGYAQKRNLDERNTRSATTIGDIESQIAELSKKGEDVQQELSPEQRIRLIAAHKLVANRSFGWSRLFADLESVMPGTVSASRIGVENVFKDGDRIKADLEFAVLSRDYGPVGQLIDNMNNSGRFRAELRSTDLQKTDRLVYSEYTLHLVYTPLNAAPASVSEPMQAQNGEVGR